jgi:acetyl esterase/lipase
MPSIVAAVYSVNVVGDNVPSGAMTGMEITTRKRFVTAARQFLAAWPSPLYEVLRTFPAKTVDLQPLWRWPLRELSEVPTPYLLWPVPLFSGSSSSIKCFVPTSSIGSNASLEIALAKQALKAGHGAVARQQVLRRLPMASEQSRPDGGDEVMKGQPAPSRAALRKSARKWRALEAIGMAIHHWMPPWSPSPSFTRRVTSTLAAGQPGEFLLHFYIPEGYPDASKHESSTRYPAVIDFHGGGFTIGSPGQDARFARVVLEQCRAVFVSVEYRLAPEYPFPTAVEDGADALLHVISHADELLVDPMRLATSGFSAGGNLAFASLLRLQQHLRSAASGSSSSALPEHRFLAVASWYPVLDYSLTRAQRRASAVKPSRTLPPSLTALFDAAYIYPADIDRRDPLLSPAKGSDALLQEALPKHILIYTCEYDMLAMEGKSFADRLAAPPLGKDVQYTMVRGVEHGWDKMPVVKGSQAAEMYLDCCTRLKGVFETG